MSRATPVAVFFIETFAFGTPAPDASDTVPERLAPATCAWIGHASPERSNIANTTNKPQVVALKFAKTIFPPRRTLPIGADSILSAVNSQQQFVKICTDPSKFQIFVPSGQPYLVERYSGVIDLSLYCRSAKHRCAPSDGV